MLFSEPTHCVSDVGVPGTHLVPWYVKLLILKASPETKPMSQRGNGKPSVTVTESVSLLSAAVAAHIAEVSRASIESKGSFAVCFSGARASWNDVQ